MFTRPKNKFFIPELGPESLDFGLDFGLDYASPANNLHAEVERVPSESFNKSMLQKFLFIIDEDIIIQELDQEIKAHLKEKYHCISSIDYNFDDPLVNVKIRARNPLATILILISKVDSTLSKKMRSDVTVSIDKILSSRDFRIFIDTFMKEIINILL